MLKRCSCECNVWIQNKGEEREKLHSEKNQFVLCHQEVEAFIAQHTAWWLKRHTPWTEGEHLHEKTWYFTSWIGASYCRPGVYRDASDRGGMPVLWIPACTRIDLALIIGVPRFLQTVHAILDEFQVQEAVVAEEMPSTSPAAYQQLCAMLGAIPITLIPHEEFKQRTHHAKGIVRTGEFCNMPKRYFDCGIVF